MGFIDYVNSLGPLQMIGVMGFLTYLLAFGAVQCGRMDGNGLVYTICNMLAAALVGVSLFAEFNLSSALIQTSFFITGLIGVLRWGLKKLAAKRSAAWGEMS